MAVFLQNLEIEAKDPRGDVSRVLDHIRHLTRLSEEEIQQIRIHKKSLDARRKSRIVYRYQVSFESPDEASLLRKYPGFLSAYSPVKPADPCESIPERVEFRYPPVIVGSGPAGSFAALTLAKAGQPSIILDRGERVEERLRTVGRLRRRGELDPESNFCFGEGGAGTFSDGKLTCGRNHPLIRYLFETWVEFGAPKEILSDAHPHIGTDYLLKIAKNTREFLEDRGCRFKFNTRFECFETGSSSRYVVLTDKGDRIPTDHIILAIGHSARETYTWLYEHGVAMSQKPFAMGARFEHPQDVINKIQFGRQTCVLPAAEYKLTSQSGERGIWTFCMCPGGHLIPTSAQEGHLAINGMSYHGRDSGFANAAVVVNVRREDFDRGHPLDGMYYQMALEKRAFRSVGGAYHSPAQRLSDFLSSRPSRGELKSTYKPGVASVRMDKILPSFIVNSLRSALSDFDKRMRGFICDESLVVGLESKTSAPIIMSRSKQGESLSHPGLFPCGEGAGFAGGIVSAALDGAKVGRCVLMSQILVNKALH